MIAWVQRIPIIDATVVLGFNKSVKPVGAIVEQGNDWVVMNGNAQPYLMKGDGCPDPIDFLMKLVSPIKRDIEADTPLMSFDKPDTNERWEVWSVK